MRSGEIRQNKATGQWVIYAPVRGKRPHQTARDSGEPQRLPDHDPNCPFCPGNEGMLSEILLETGHDRGEDYAWQTRAILNKFPALVPEGRPGRSIREDFYLSMPGYGRHEVIIESPLHNQDIAQMMDEEVELVIETYHRRYVELMEEYRNMMTIIFRNHGAKAGTSLVHPHSQIVVTGMVPQHIRSREEQAQRYFDAWGRCVYCDILEHELRHGLRVIKECETFAAFIPYAADVPYEIWIVPKKHEADFGKISHREKADLAHTLRYILQKLYDKLDDPSYNYVINTSARYKADEPQLHWYLQIRPRLTTQAGFEVGSGMSINPNMPEDNADFLNVIEETVKRERQGQAGRKGRSKNA